LARRAVNRQDRDATRIGTQTFEFISAGVMAGVTQ
jgi:hypothetical protein